MTIFANELPPEFPFPEKVNTVVCCDLDETYIPFSPENKVYGGVNELEQYMYYSAADKGILLGWITGTNLPSALRKSEGYISRSPHFICCSLATEFYWVRNGQLIRSEKWLSRIEKSGFHASSVNRILESIREKNIKIVGQPADYQGPYKISFYYYIRPEMEADFAWIETLCTQWNIRVLLTRCNPAAGDPKNCYDVEFIPTCCGKDQAVAFLKEEMQLPRRSIFAFGDSCNDFPMFSQAGHAYLVANADHLAISLHGNCLDKPYCHGILSVLAEI